MFSNSIFGTTFIKKYQTQLKFKSKPHFLIANTGFMIKKSFSTNKGKNISVVGLGPIGLAYALESCQNDSKRRNVIAVTDRQSFTRKQVLSLDKDVIDYIKTIIDKKVFQAILDSKKIEEIPYKDTVYYLVQIKTLEELLFNELLKFQNKNLKIIYTKRNESKITIDKDQFNITFSHTLDSATPVTVPFKYLVTTDGALHNTISQIKDSGIHYHRIHCAMVHDKHATISTEISPAFSSSVPVYLKQGADNMPSINELWQNGWRLHSPPQARLFTVNNTLYLGTEYPIDRSTDDVAIDLWGNIMLRYYFPEEAVNKLKDNMISRAFTNFKIRLEESNRVFVALPSNLLAPKTFYSSALCFPAGDALKLPHYHSGSGAVTGLRQARLFGKFLKSKQTLTDLFTYQNGMEFLLEENRKKIDKILAERELLETHEKLKMKK